MKKDIEIPEVNGLALLALYEYNDELGEKVWNICLFNEREATMDTVMVVLRGHADDKRTSVMRRTVAKLSPGSLARLEFLPENLLNFQNEYLVTFFEGNTMFEKNFILEPGVLSTEKLIDIPAVGKQGLRFE